MYRIFCESYERFIKDFEGAASNESRYEIAKPLKLIIDVESYHREKEANSQRYKQLSDLLHYMNSNVDRYPKFKAFLWMLESRGIGGAYYGVSDIHILEEQAKLVNIFLSLAYWKETA